MKIEIVPFFQEHEAQWDAYVKKNGDTTFYHQIGWKNVVEKTYHHQSHYIFAKDEADRIIGIFPIFFIKNVFFKKKIVSVPFAPYGGVCADNEEVENSLVNYAISISQGMNADYCEFRSFSHGKNRENFNCTSIYSTCILDLRKGTSQLWEDLNRKVRNMIRKAETNNLIFEIDSKRESIADFYEIYVNNMKHLGTPVHSIHFFYHIYDIFPSDVSIAKVKQGNTIIASLYLLRFKGMLISGWGASLVQYLKYSPNDFLYWNSIKYGSENGYDYFDFGRSLINSNNFKFKSRWGGVSKSLRYCYYPATIEIKPPQQEFSYYAKIWSYIPGSIIKILGPKIRKYIV